MNHHFFNDPNPSDIDDPSPEPSGVSDDPFDPPDPSGIDDPGYDGDGPHPLYPEAELASHSLEPILGDHDDVTGHPKQEAQVWHLQENDDTCATSSQQSILEDLTEQTAMNPFEAQKREALQLLQAGISLAQRQKDREALARLEAAAKHLAEGKLVVVVAGEFKQGKSSLINALLDETENLFPVDVDVATNLVTTIAYGEAEEIRVVLGRSSMEAQKRIRREEIVDYVTEQRNPHNQREARMLMIQSPNPRLKEGLVLVDTPGVGGLNVKHTDITYAFIPTADAILFVSDALKPLTEIELEFVAMVARHCPHVIYTVTKKDAGDWRSVLDSNREKLAKLLKRPGEGVPLIAVSSQLKLTYLKSQDPEDLQDSNFAALERALWELLNVQRGKILVTRALVELGRTAEEIRRPIEAEWGVYQQESVEALDRMEGELEKAVEQQKLLLVKDAAWRTELSRGMVDTRFRILERFQEGFLAIRRQPEGYLDNARCLAHPEQIVGLVETHIDALMAELAKELGRQAGALHGDLEATTELTINPFAIGSLEQRLKPQCRMESIKKAGWWFKTLGTVRTSTFMATPGATVGAVVGGGIGGLAGLFLGGVGVGLGAQIGAYCGSALGGVGGMATGIKEGLAQNKERDKASVRKVLLPFIDDSQRFCNSALNRAIVELERSMEDELVEQIRREKANCERTLKSLQEARKLTQEQAARKAAEVKVPLQHWDRLLQLGERLIRSVNEGAQPPPVSAFRPKTAETATTELGDRADDA